MYKNKYELVNDLLEIKTSSEVSLDSLLEDYGWDSLVVIKLLSMVSEHYGIAINPDELENIRNFYDLFQFIEAQSIFDD